MAARSLHPPRRPGEAGPVAPGPVAGYRPDRGAWAYEYNGFDELVKQTDARGYYQALSYDGLGRLITRSDHAPDDNDADTDELEATARWTYDGATNGLGQLQTVTDGTYTRTHSYDSLGRPATTTHNLGGSDGTYYSRQTYDQYGRVHQVFDATRIRNTPADWNDNVVEVQYNAQGYAHKWVDGVQVNNTTRRTYREIRSQDARGNVTGETLGGGAIRTTRAFDAGTGRIRSITSEDVLDRQVQALTYEWDLVGNLTTRTEGSVGKSLSEAFSYDTLNRLTQSQVTGRSAQTVTYDALGNITCKRDVDGTDCKRAGARNYTYGTGTGTDVPAVPGPHAVTRAGTLNYSYDANGNVLTERRTGAGSDARSFSYNAFNKVKSIEKGTHTTSFAYGPERSRYKRTDKVVTGTGTSTTTTLYLGTVEKVIAPDGSFTYKRYIADGVLVEQQHNTGGARTGEDTRYLLRDHLGSIDVITNVTGTVVQDLSFDAWGQRRAPDDWTVLALLRLTDTTHGRHTTRGYTGHEMLDAVGIIHMNGRIYDPNLGRFMQADPVIQFPDYSQSWNRYSYVLNNPLAYTDPTGYIIPIFTALAVGIVASGIVKTTILAAALIGAGVFADSLVQGVPLGKAFLAGVSAAALTAAALGTLPGRFGLNLATFKHVATVSAVGGITTSLQGGKFGNGFLSAGLGSVAPALPGLRQLAATGIGGRALVSAVTAGTVSEITGGKFANGAVTAAFLSVVSGAAQARAQRGFREGLSPAEFEARFGMPIEESISRYETDTGELFPLTKQDTLRLFTDEAFAEKQVIPKGNLDTTYRDILNMHAARTVAGVSAGGYVRQPWYKNLFHKPFRYTKWVGPNGHFEAVFDSYDKAVLDGPYKGTFNFFSPADVSGHWNADVVPYVRRWWWGN